MFIPAAHIPIPPRTAIAASRGLSGFQIMLAVLVTLLVVVGVLGLLLNILFTELYFASPPQGDRAMGLVIPFFITVAGALLCTFASFLCACRGGDSLLRLIPTSPVVAGLIAVAVTFGVVVAAFMAFLCWCEPNMIGHRGSAVVVMLGWIAGIIGPLLLGVGLLCGAWMSGNAARAEPQVVRPLAVMFWGLVCIASIGYVLGGFAMYQSLAQQAANRAAALKQAMLRSMSIQQELALPPVQRLKNELDAMSPSTPLWPLVAYFPETTQRFPLDAACRELLIERVLRVPELDRAMLETAGGRYYLYRQGVADFISAAPDAMVREHEKAWGQALLLGIQTTADAIACRPAWLSETFDLKPDALAHVQSLVNSVEKFRGLPSHASLRAAMQALANSTDGLTEDGGKKQLIRLLEKSGYTPAPGPRNP